MNIFPHHSEILVSSYSCEEVAKKLAAVTRKVNYMDARDYTVERYRFNGKVNKNQFSLSLIIKRADSFLPRISGKVEPTSSGSILFLRYSLFPGSVFFLAFWSIITSLMTVFFIFSQNQWIYAAASLFAGVGNFAFAWFYFKSKLKESQSIFHEMLSLQEKD